MLNLVILKEEVQHGVRRLSSLSSTLACFGVRTVCALTRTINATCSALRVSRWCAYNGQKVECEMLDHHPSEHRIKEM